MDQIRRKKFTAEKKIGFCNPDLGDDIRSGSDSAMENEPDPQLCLEDGRDLGLDLGRRVLLEQGGGL